MTDAPIKFGAVVASIVAFGMLLLATPMVLERVLNLVLWQFKDGLGAPMGGLISTSSFWMSVPYFLIAFVAVLFSWTPSNARWLKPTAIGLVVIEALTVWGLSALGLRA